MPPLAFIHNKYKTCVHAQLYYLTQILNYKEKLNQDQYNVMCEQFRIAIWRRSWDILIKIFLPVKFKQIQFSDDGVTHCLNIIIWNFVH
jgi:hypothetical protein